ncbi:hypothetical protein Amsp01_094810 [Amycolatopsis sp. NBRC 101858]|uniref:DUF305 domain-containing protein n=1 Tax=Amycolatopsis sp. NBRC 101858 TaxID=3032200 RepID=UPI0024A03017|nr:DUF305 domain-containing protein [Amycolatopsis sp. NBRC 101858]GLY43458.1 hypothetical protein Amsp01_094810 [Amycolatopsis sp. NBRC 101858]
MSRKFLAGFVLSAALALTGCATPADHNDADVAFARQMVPHHQQAVEMATPVPQHTKNPQVVALANGIAQAQQPEIDQLTAWLKQWGAPAMTDHGSMPGMVDPGDLDTLRDAAYDRKWLTLMLDHHRGAIDMARTEVAQGSNAEAKAMAQRIADTQQAEVDRMTGLLAA